VILVDVDELSAIDCEHSAGGLYDAVWVLAMRRGQPLGMVVIEAGTPTIEADELERLLHEALGETWHVDAPDEADDMALPHATVVVPTNVSRPQQLLTCVERLIDLDYPDLEIVVVDNRRTTEQGEDILASLTGLPRVHVVVERRPGISAARNRGVAAATGEIVAFTDDDVEVDRRWLRALGRRFVEERRADAVTGLVVPKELETPAQLWFEQSGSGLDGAYARLSFELAAPDRAGGVPLGVPRFRVIRRVANEALVSTGSLYATGEFGIGCNMAFRTEALRSLGGFDEALGAGTPTHGGEDLAALIGLLADGRGLAYEPAAIVHHIHRRGTDELERQLSGYGIGFTAMLVALIRQDPRHLAGLLGMIPAALRLSLARSSAKQSRRPVDYPSHLARRELRGMVGGPLAYARSRRAQRRWKA
jgi:hypothetical protein